VLAAAFQQGKNDGAALQIRPEADTGEEPLLPGL